MAEINKGLCCLDCINHKTRIFRDENFLVEWMKKNNVLLIRPPKPWLRQFVNDGYLQLFWCSAEINIRPIMKELNRNYYENYIDCEEKK